MKYKISLLHPKYWFSWLVAALGYGLVKILPYTWLMQLGKGLGRIMAKLMRERMLVAKTNIHLCFAHGEKDWRTIYDEHIDSLGKGVFEMAMAWFLSPHYFLHRVRHVGYEGVDRAIAEGRGVLFLGVHTTGLDFGAPLLNNRYKTHVTYKKSKNAVLDCVMSRGRLRNTAGVIEHSNIRAILTKLKAGECVWYGCDQDFSSFARCVFAPFYGVAAYTLPYYARLAEKTGAAVIPVAGFRDQANGCFTARYLPEIKVEGMNDKQAAYVMNQAIEQLLDGFEDQYYWVHRRFKTRPNGEAPVYAKKASHTRRERKALRRQGKHNG